MIETKVYGNRKTIMIGQDSYYIALPVLLTGSNNAVIKAGEPLTGNLGSRKSSRFSASTSGAVGILLHEVQLDAQGKGNGTIVVAGCVDKLKLDSTVAGHITTAAIPTIIMTEGSEI